jgi:hypothetical protein
MYPDLVYAFPENLGLRTRIRHVGPWESERITILPLECLAALYEQPRKSSFVPIVA